MDAFGSERFVTLIAAVVSLDERRVDYINAGHPAGLLFSEDRRRVAVSRARVRSCRRPSPIVAWEQRSVAFEPGDLLFLYTDGVSDALAGGRLGRRGARPADSAAGESGWGARSIRSSRGYGNGSAGARSLTI